MPNLGSFLETMPGIWMPPTVLRLFYHFSLWNIGLERLFILMPKTPGIESTQIYTEARNLYSEVMTSGRAGGLKTVNRSKRIGNTWPT